jgi:hypothetical protein
VLSGRRLTEAYQVPREAGRLEDNDLVGHSSTSVTETVYRHEIRPALTKGATAMNRILKASAAKSA